MNTTYEPLEESKLDVPEIELSSSPVPPVLTLQSDDTADIDIDDIDGMEQLVLEPPIVEHKIMSPRIVTPIYLVTAIISYIIFPITGITAFIFAMLGHEADNKHQTTVAMQFAFYAKIFIILSFFLASAFLILGAAIIILVVSLSV